jgi:hypothetical protein
VKILSVTYGLPYPPNEGAKIRDYHLLREVARSAEVRVCALLKDEVQMPDAGPLHEFCASVEPFRVPKRGWARHLRDASHHAMAGRPLATYPFYFDEFAAMIRATAVRCKADLIQIEHSFLAPYLTAAPAGCRTVLSFPHWLQCDALRCAGDPVGSGAGVRLGSGRQIVTRSPYPETDAKFSTDHGDQAVTATSSLARPPGASRSALWETRAKRTPSAPSLRRCAHSTRERRLDWQSVGKQSWAGDRHWRRTGGSNARAFRRVPYYRRAAIAIAPLRAVADAFEDLRR